MEKKHVLEKTGRENYLAAIDGNRFDIKGKGHPYVYDTFVEDGVEKKRMI